MTYYEKIKNGTKEDLINEICLIMEWARELTPGTWDNIHNWSYSDYEKCLEAYICDVLDREMEE